MSKTTKILTTVVAIALVITAMVVGIYAATQGSATITAKVNWKAETGIAFTFSGSVSGGTAVGADASKGYSLTVDVTTANPTGTADLSADFINNSTTGTNDPGDITYTYTVAVPSTAVNKVIVKITSEPATDSAKNVTVTATHTIGGSAASVDSTAGGYIVSANETLTVTYVLAVAIDDSDVSEFAAGPSFEFSKGAAVSAS